jgi:hypothetical protein
VAFFIPWPSRCSLSRCIVDSGPREVHCDAAPVPKPAGETGETGATFFYTQTPRCSLSRCILDSGPRDVHCDAAPLPKPAGETVETGATFFQTQAPAMFTVTLHPYQDAQRNRDKREQYFFLARSPRRSLSRNDLTRADMVLTPRSRPRSAGPTSGQPCLGELRDGVRPTHKRNFLSPVSPVSPVLAFGSVWR